MAKSHDELPSASSGRGGERRVRVGDVDLAVQDNGWGRPFLWAHGLLSSMDQEDETGIFGWADLTDRMRVIRYDARGHGDSEASPDPADYTWPSLGTDMLGLLDALAVDRAVLGGASMGAATSIYAALQAPERVERLVLAIPPTAWATRGPQRLAYKSGATALAVTGLRTLVATMRAVPSLPSVIAPRSAASREKSVQQLLKSDRTTVTNILRGAGRSDLPAPAQLAGLTMPTLILAWRGDPGHPQYTARKLAEALPNATLHTAARARDLAEWGALVRRFVSA